MPRFQLKAPDQQELPAVAKLITETFLAEGPLETCLRPSAEEYAAVMEHFCRISHEENLLLVARASESSQLLGFAVGVDFTTDLSLARSPTWLAPIEAILDEATPFQEPKRGKTMCYHMIGVDPNPSIVLTPQEKVELTDLMFWSLLDVAKSQGFVRAISSSVSAFTRSLLEEAGFKQHGWVRYKDFQFEGAKPFASLRFHGRVASYLASLDALSWPQDDAP